MSYYRFFSTALLLVCILSCMKRSDNFNFATLMINEKNERHLLSIKFKNVQDETIGMYLNGNARQKISGDSLLAKLIYDVILEVEQNGIILTSEDVEFLEFSISERVNELIFLKPGEELEFPIFYRGNLKNDFKLVDAPFRIRIRTNMDFNQIIKLMNEEEKKYLENNPTIKLISEEIITPFIEYE